MLKQILKTKKSECHPDRMLYARNLCRNCYEKWLKKNNPEYALRQKEKTATWIKQNQEKKKLSDKKWRAKQDPEYDRIRQLARYGLTPEDYDNILKHQNYVCAICGKSSARRLNIDHDHSTGEIRGLLCFRCNFGLSYFSESENILRNAADYIAYNKNNPILYSVNNIEKSVNAPIELFEKLGCKTKSIPDDIKKEIQLLHSNGASLGEIHTIYPKYSRSAIFRVYHKKPQRNK